MKILPVILFTLVSITSFSQYRQRDSTVYHPQLYIPQTKSTPWHSTEITKAIRVPVVLTAISLYTMTDNDHFSREEVKEERDEWAPHYHHKVDNYLQFAPIAIVYGLNAVGVKGKNDFRNRTALLLKSELLVTAIVFPLKKITAVQRPDNSTPNSFPSGHTAQAFAAATFMAKEYGENSVWYSVGAYSIATCVGAMRILNNRHWVSDVFAGAAIGILSTNLVYLTHHQLTGKKKQHQTLVVPSYDGQTGMVTMIHTLN